MTKLSAPTGYTMHNELCCLFPAAVSIHVELRSSSADSNKSTENRLMIQLRSLGPPGTDNPAEEVISRKSEEILSLERQVNQELMRLGITTHQFTFVLKHSIISHFMSKSDEQLHQLREHYETGLMKAVLERIFSLLAGRQVDIGQLRWTTEEYQKCQQQFSAITSKPRFFGNCRHFQIP